MKERLKALLKAWTHCSGREGRRILLLIPLLALIALLFVWQGKPRFERSFTMYGDRVLDSLNRARSSRASQSGGGEDSCRLFSFDPNTIGRDGLQRLGFSAKQADGIVHYRRAGAVFRTPSDFARCRMVSPEKYRELEPYIAIRADGNFSKTETKRAAVRDKTPSVRDSLFFFDPNTVGRDGLQRLGFSAKQADGIVHYRQAGAVFRTSSDFARCRMVSPERYRKLEPYIRIDSVPGHDRPAERRETGDSLPSATFASVELNGADSAALVAVRGIGPLTAGRIVRYRERLGGFARIGQLREIEGMTDENYRRILQQIWVDSSKIQKIDINFALPLQLRDHPYLPERVLNRLLKYRQLKGGWRSIRDLTERHIISEQQAEKLSPYLCFRVQ